MWQMKLKHYYFQYFLKAANHEIQFHFVLMIILDIARHHWMYTIYAWVFKVFFISLKPWAVKCSIPLLCSRRKHTFNWMIAKGEKTRRELSKVWVVQRRKILDASAKLPTLWDSAFPVITNVMLLVYSELDLEHIMGQIISC